METEKETNYLFSTSKFKTTVYRKPTFSGVYSNFEKFLPSVLLIWYGIYFSLDVFAFTQLGQNSVQN